MEPSQAQQVEVSENLRRPGFEAFSELKAVIVETETERLDRYGSTAQRLN